MSHETVEVKPYGTKNDTYGAPAAAVKVEVKPAYGQKVETHAAPAPSSFNIGGARSDIEVKPYGTQDIRDTGLNKSRVTTTTTTVKPLEQWRNPLMATLLGITLALTLLSLSYLPRAISGVWHWTSSHAPWAHSQPKHSEPVQKIYDAYDSVTRKNPREVYDEAKDYVQGSGDSLYERVKQTGEDLYEKARDTVYSGPSLTEEAKIGACKAAQKARDVACDGINTRSWTLDASARNARDAVRDTARDARYKADEAADRAAGMFETAKQKAADVLESAKDTITYPLNAASENLQYAKDTVMNSGHQTRDRVEDRAAHTYRAAQDTVQEGVQDAKENVRSAKDTVLNAGQKVKDTVVNMAQKAKDTVVGSGARDHEEVHVKNGGRGPTKVKVEVQEL